MVQKIQKSIVQELCTTLDLKSPSSMAQVMVAVSGGKDSVGLLTNLAQASERNTHYGLSAGYVNHKVQEQKEQEKEFQTVCLVCRLLTVPLYSVSLCNIPSCDIVSEALLRERRYKALCAMAQAQNVDYIVTAHHQGDVYENVLMRLFMHGAWQGLSEIPKIRKIRHEHKDIFVVRPALKTLPEHFHVQNLPHHVDASNVDNRYKRNALRSEIIPPIEKHFPNAAKCVTAFAHAQSQLRTFVESTVPSWLVIHDYITLSFAVFQNLSPVQQNHVLYKGANILGVSHLSHSFLEACQKSLLQHTSSIRIKNTILMKCGSQLLWKKMPQNPKNETANNCISKKEQFFVQSRLYLSYTHTHLWSVTTDDSCNMKDCIVYVLPSIPPIYVQFLKKSDMIAQRNKKLRIMSILKNTCSDILYHIPVVCDTRGILCVAGETFLQRTFCRFYDEKNNAIDDTMKLCTITIAYHLIGLLIGS